MEGGGAASSSTVQPSGKSYTIDELLDGYTSPCDEKLAECLHMELERIPGQVKLRKMKVMREVSTRKAEKVGLVD